MTKLSDNQKIRTPDSQIVSFGFTVVELLVVMGIFAILATFTTINLTGSQHHAALSTTIDTLASDLHEQQFKAMQGEKIYNGTKLAGIYFQSDRYILFQRGSYQANDSSNFTVTLPPTVTFSTINLPSSTLLFASGSGQVVGFVNGTNTLVLHDTSSTEQKTITINQYGNIISVN